MSASAITAIKQLFATEEPAALGPQPRAGVLSESDLNARLNAWLPQSKLPSARQQVVRALLLLWHDHLEASHQIAQGVENAEGSFVHALMHRREPDGWNSKYWWRRVGDHPAFAEISRRVAAQLSTVGDHPLRAQLVPGDEWHPAAFVDACEAAWEQRDTARIRLLRQLQQLEAEALLEYLLGKG